MPLEWSQHFTAIIRRLRAVNSVADGWVWLKIKLIQTLWVSLLHARMRKIHSKKKVLEGSQQISHCKSLRIFYDAQGKLTPQSAFDST